MKRIGCQPTTMGSRYQIPFLTEEEQIINLITVKGFDPDAVGLKFIKSGEEIYSICFASVRSLFNDNEVPVGKTIDDMAELYHVISYDLVDKLKFDAVRRYNLPEEDPDSLKYMQCIKYFQLSASTFNRLIIRSKGFNFLFYLFIVIIQKIKILFHSILLAVENIY